MNSIIGILLLTLAIISQVLANNNQFQQKSVMQQLKEANQGNEDTSSKSAPLKCFFNSHAIESLSDMDKDCVREMRTQIQKEIDACATYLAMAAHFSRDTVNRPGLAEFFFKSAREEREHASKLMAYLAMRGDLNDNLSKLISVPAVEQSEWTAYGALADAFQLETQVTNLIRELIKTCEGGKNDYHLVDYLTVEFLEEQLSCERELAGKITTLDKMLKAQGQLGEFLFDKQM